MKITLEHLTKVFENKKAGRRVTAVNDLNVEIPSGKLVGLLGPSGCGKSTTLFMLSGLEEPTSGRIIFGEDDVTDLAPEKRGIGLVFQNYALYPHMTVEENIMFPLLNMRVKKADAKVRAAEAAKMVQIEDLLLRKPSELSGGQQQRVAIARALVKFPTVFVTHDQEEAMSICDIMLVMKLGVLQQVGVPQSIYDDPANLFVANFLGTPPINIFLGEIKDHKVYIGDEAIQDTEFEDQEIYVGVRPEGFIADAKGPLTLLKDHVEIMGRDKSIVSVHPSSTKPTVRAIIDADVVIPDTKTVKFSLKPNKVFLSNRETEKRLRVNEEENKNESVVEEA